MSLNRTFHVNGTLPGADTVFVFGSNEQGLHGLGAAAIAQEFYGAIRYKGIGRVGQSYAIPTRYWHDSVRRVQTLPFEKVKQYISDFCDYTIANPDVKFFVTEVGCLNAGFDPTAIAPLFATAINCSFSENWDTIMDVEKVKSDEYDAVADAKEKLKNFDPAAVEWLRYRFFIAVDDPRPVVFPPPGPWWISGENDSHFVLIAYLPKDIKISDYWPEVTESDIDFVEEQPEGIKFTDRFPKPDWWPF